MYHAEKRGQNLDDPDFIDKLPQMNPQWKPEEKRLWLELARKYGTDAKKISTEMGTKSEIQCKRRQWYFYDNMIKGKMPVDPILLESL